MTEIKFWPALEVVRKAFDGIPLDRKVKHTFVVDWKTGAKEEHTEASWLRRLHDLGRCNVRQVERGKRFKELVLCVGRRGGKSVFGSWLAADAFFRLAKNPPQARWGWPEGTPVRVLFCSTDKDQATLGVDEVRRFVAGAGLDPSISFSAMSIKDARTGAVVLGRSSYSKKKPDAPVAFAVLDDLPHGEDFKGVRAAVLAAGRRTAPRDQCDRRRIAGDPEIRVVSCFTPPVMEKGKDYAFKLFRSGFKPQNPNDALCVQIPAWEANPTLPSEWFAKHAAKDSTTFKAEHGAEFVGKDGNPWK